MKKVLTTTAVIVSLSLLSTGCATMISGKPEVKLASSPSGAKVNIGGQTVCNATPCKVKIDNFDNGDTVTFSKDGYASQKKVLGKSFNPATLLGAFFGLSGLFSTSTDAATGAIHKASPHNIYVELQPTKAAIMKKVQEKAKKQEKENEQEAHEFKPVSDDE